MARRKRFLAVLAATLLAAVAVSGFATNRPNILWLTWEDANSQIGAFGDTFAVTPRLDALSRESVRFTQAFAYTGACSPSRSCLITGVYPLRLGAHQMRSTISAPGQKDASDYVNRMVEYLPGRIGGEEPAAR